MARQSINIKGQKLVWDVDFAAAASVQKWTRRNPDRLLKEIEEMSEHLPLWILALGESGGWSSNVLPCPNCGNFIVFKDGIRCIQCGRKQPISENAYYLCWFGLFEFDVSRLENVRSYLEENKVRGHPFIQKAGKSKLIVPIECFYQSDFPRSAPLIQYNPSFFDLPRLNNPRPGSHVIHVVGDRQMCLYLGNNRSGSWKGDTMREALMTHAYPHVVMLLAYSNGNRHAFSKVTKY